MSFKERENAILEYLMEHKEATVSELAHTLFVSEPTMRRDLYALSRAVRRTRAREAKISPKPSESGSKRTPRRSSQDARFP